MREENDGPMVRLDPPPHRTHRNLGVGAISLVQLGFELLFVKLAHYEFGATALAVVGLALLGVALAGPAIRLSGGARGAAERALLVLPPAALLAGALLFHLDHRPIPTTWLPLHVLALGSACLLVLGLTAVPVYLELRRSPEAVHPTYAASLAGAALGVVLTLGLLALGGDVLAYAALLGACALPAFLLLDPGRARQAALALSAASALMAWLVFPRLDAAAHPNAIYLSSDALSRIEVRRGPHGTLRFRTAGVNTGTTTAPSDRAARAALASMPVTLPLHSSPRRVLLLGAGAGKNVIEALDLGAEQVVAVEINGMIPGFMRRELPARDDPYRDPRVTLVIGEGRETAARLAARVKLGEPRFDLVYAPIATLYGNSGQPVVETYLMTEEAFSLYLGMLTPEGTAGAFFGEGGLHKMVSALAGALREHGVAPAPHLLLVRFGDQFALLARPGRAFTNEDRESFARVCPGGQLVDVQSELDRRSPALTDDAPYLLGAGGDAGDKFVLISHRLGFTRGLLLGALAALAATLLASLSSGRGPGTRGLGFVSAFAAMGTAYAVLQTVAIQRLGFLLGHPVLGVAVVLPSTLTGTALGARIAGGLAPARASLWRGTSTTLLVTVIGIAAFAEPRVLVELGWSPAARVVASALAAALPFVVAGSFFPTAFARVEREMPNRTEWCWLANGVGAVVGSIFTVYGGMRLGFRATLAVPAVLYVTLAAWEALGRRPRLGQAADLGVPVALALTLGGSVWLMERAAGMLE